MMSSILNKPRLLFAGFLTLCAHAAIVYIMVVNKKDIEQPPAPQQIVTVAFKTITKPEPPKPVIVPPKIQPKPQPKKITKKPARKKLIKKKITPKKPVKKTPIKKAPPKPVTKKAPIKKAAPKPVQQAVTKPAPVTKPTVKTSKPKTGDKAVRLISKKLDYPRSARSRGQEDTVYVRILVGTDGRPKSIKMHKASRFAKLNMGAIKTVRSMRFAPAIKNGQKVEQWVTIPIQFKLQ